MCLQGDTCRCWAGAAASRLLCSHRQGFVVLHPWPRCCVFIGRGSYFTPSLHMAATRTVYMAQQRFAAVSPLLGLGQAPAKARHGAAMPSNPESAGAFAFARMISTYKCPPAPSWPARCAADVPAGHQPGRRQPAARQHPGDDRRHAMRARALMSARAGARGCRRVAAARCQHSAWEQC